MISVGFIGLLRLSASATVRVILPRWDDDVMPVYNITLSSLFPANTSKIIYNVNSVIVNIRKGKHENAFLRPYTYKDVLIQYEWKSVNSELKLNWSHFTEFEFGFYALASKAIFRART